ncbi:YiiX/YebB-like N1pC/P60 family cysteine hydrolase [Bradyrhizobium sp. Leo121]|uniref:YiiX/YebB-like N1pC/P60 family cysteine hydrolase n=1 Tax=Bradyrhizobium sp. Leo121 TaxID=1571195 RepID=UPI001029D793|nr:YiiX/YebB-like N1pC/P60 family cysteine hydrolase [Bradyrhizobium sp. Leo121]RZN34234.1 lipo-like protein [Bradyrhizobium sp. Leo121]
MGWMFENVGRLIAWLQKPANHCEPLTSKDSAALRDTLRPGDVLLVEGKGRISGGIKYLTQSTWSHSALYVGPIAGAATEGEPHVLVEANLDEGVVSAPLSKYLHCQTRICRPVGLSEADREKVCRYGSERIGLGYDFRNVIDLMRYLFPWPVAPRWRRRPIALGSGDASRIICSSLIAQAFDAVRYPILPKITRIESQTARREIAETRHSSLYAPRDFDISPYFMVVKPTLAFGFNYRDMQWADLLQVHTTQATLAPEIEGAIATGGLAKISAKALSCAMLTDD